MRVLHLFLVVTLASSVSSAACAKARAATEPVVPVLEPPPPPPRVVSQFPEEPVPTIAPGPVEVALAAPPAKAPVQPPAKPEPVKPEPEPLRTEPERPAPGAPALTLKPASGVTAKTVAAIRSLLDTAQRDLLRVNYAALNADRRAQFDTARGFMLQAEEALKANNLAFASKLADKAATMAAVLVR